MVNTWSNEEMAKLIELGAKTASKHSWKARKGMSFIVFNKIARDMEAAGFDNPLLYFNTHENCNTHVINSYVDHMLLEMPKF